MGLTERPASVATLKQSTSHHWVSWSVTEGDAWPEAQMACTAPDDAFCRTYCDRSECEDGCTDIYGHERKPMGCCNLVDWMEDAGVMDSYEGKPHPASDGPIVVVWDGDHYAWWYEDNGVVVPHAVTR